MRSLQSQAVFPRDSSTNRVIQAGFSQQCGGELILKMVKFKEYKMEYQEKVKSSGDDSNWDIK